MLDQALWLDGFERESKKKGQLEVEFPQFFWILSRNHRATGLDPTWRLAYSTSPLVAGAH
jgi:hypothetical protein